MDNVCRNRKPFHYQVLVILNALLNSPNDFSGTKDQWERRIFLNACHYTVVIYDGVGHGSRFHADRAEIIYRDFNRALKRARSHPRALIYGVTENGRSDLLSRSRWEEYENDWKLSILGGGPGR